MSSNLEQLETCLLYGGVCDYPSNVCYECPKHGRMSRYLTFCAQSTLEQTGRKE
jgi:hypothetical protein